MLGKMLTKCQEFISRFEQNIVVDKLQLYQVHLLLAETVT